MVRRSQRWMCWLAEVVGGGQREERLPLLLANMQAQGLHEPGSLAEAQLEWYSDLRRYGTVPHAGWVLALIGWCSLRPAKTISETSWPSHAREALLLPS